MSLGLSPLRVTSFLLDADDGCVSQEPSWHRVQCDEMSLSLNLAVLGETRAAGALTCTWLCLVPSASPVPTYLCNLKGLLPVFSVVVGQGETPPRENKKRADHPHE